MGLFGANFSHILLIGGFMSNFQYFYDEDYQKFNFYVNDALVYEFEKCDPMTEKEAYNLAEELYIEYLQNK